MVTIIEQIAKIEREQYGVGERQPHVGYLTADGTPTPHGVCGIPSDAMLGDELSSTEAARMSAERAWPVEVGGDVIGYLRDDAQGLSFREVSA